MSDDKNKEKELTNDELDTASGGHPMGPRGGHGIEGQHVGHKVEEDIRIGGGHHREAE
jgi:hypothetical protein